MESNKNIGLLVTALMLLAVFAGSVSAFATISNVEVSGVQGLTAGNIAVSAGQVIPVRVVFNATSNASDVRVKLWLSGGQDYSVSSERFDVIAGNVYSRLMSVQIPFNIDPQESLKLEVALESQNTQVSKEVALNAQRESYLVELLDVNFDPKVQAGDNIAVNVVLKNRGLKLAEDTFVTARIPALGIQRRAYFGDLSPVDQSKPDKEDATERVLYLPIPAGTPAGIYTVEFEASNADSTTTTIKKIAVAGASESSTVVAPMTSRTFGVGAQGSYAVTLVNTGKSVKVYELSFDAPAGLSVSSDDSIVVLPAGSSKTVNVMASASNPGKYAFAVKVNADNELVKQESFVANVEGSRAGNATVVLTVILAIVFVVLLVVLIVLLTRKPQKTEEFGESYY